MASKTISVTKEVYDLLTRFKLPHESFGDAIKRLCEEKTANSVYQWVNSRTLWSNMTDEEFKEIQGNIKDIRKQLTIQEVDMNNDG